MEYKTVIEIINEAENPTEAADIAGEYLRGTIDTGVRMKCISKPLRNYIAIRTVLLALLFISFIGFASFRINKNISTYPAPIRSVSAIQPPLKTQLYDKKFIDEWEQKKH